MKTEKQIKAEIKRLEKLVAGEGIAVYAAAQHSSIQMLKWVLSDD